MAKPFYHRPDPEDPKYVLCHDLLAPEGYGEIIGGGERTWSEQEILERIDEEGTPRDPYEFYIDVRRYGGVPHGGFGLGVIVFAVGFLEPNTFVKSSRSRMTADESLREAIECG